MDVRDFEELLESLSSGEKKLSGKPGKYKGSPIKDIKKLKEQAALYNKQEKFKVNDIVTWKSAEWKNKTVPLFNQPAIVLEVLENPIFDTEKHGGGETSASSTYFREQLDIVLGSLSPDREGSILRFHHDSRRFRKI